MKPSLPILLVLLLCIFAAGYSNAATLTVTKIEDTNDGVCDGDCSLREAVVSAAAGDTVVFSPLFNTPQTITLTLGQINITQNLTITGTGQTLVTISGNNASRIFDISGGADVNISGMTFRDGNVGASDPSEAFGGAIRVTDSTLNVTNATYTNNTAFNAQFSLGEGGAIYGSQNSSLVLSNLVVRGNSSRGPIISSYSSAHIQDSLLEQNNSTGIVALNLTVTRCIISGNTGGGAAGIHSLITDSIISNNNNSGIRDSDTDSTMTIERCLISGNRRLDRPGGGVLSSGTTVIKNSRIINNIAFGTGGGIANTGDLYVINSAVTGNTTNFESGGFHNGGAGINNSIGHLFLVNSTVSGNSSSGTSIAVGGGVYIDVDGANPNGRLTGRNSTVSNNQSIGGGGGVRVDSGGTATILNSIIAGNNSTATNEEDVSGSFGSQGTNLIGNTTGSLGWIASDLLNVPPMLGPLLDNGGATITHALLNGSPAINAGNNALAIDPLTQMPLTVDQRGFLRFYGGVVDIGAYEVQPEITGTIIYGNATGAPTPRFVSGVLLSAVGLPNVSATSRADGTYTLGGFGSGAYTVTPLKTGGANGISSFDAGLIAKHVAGTQVLTGNQLIVADVSGNGTLSSFDAGQVARYTVGIGGFGSSGNWIFIPVNRTYSSVNSTVTGEDFIALLMGDVSGNWQPIGDSVRAPKVR